jgi:hypothetical protein
MSRMFPSTWNNSAEERETHVKFDRDAFELPLSVPASLREAMLTGVTSGAWRSIRKSEETKTTVPTAIAATNGHFPEDCGLTVQSRSGAMVSDSSLDLRDRDRPREGS